MVLSSRGPGHRPLTAETRVRIPLGLPKELINQLKAGFLFYPLSYFPVPKWVGGDGETIDCQAFILNDNFSYSFIHSKAYCRGLNPLYNLLYIYSLMILKSFIFGFSDHLDQRVSLPNFQNAFPAS